ncbi:NADP-dependent oxidoreductase domain-containing protein [Mycena metata]|uniref:NADP-dependent oxidoreductase domain-containing protein n=1 Tax=Mycena metata TaxID=1033252 RepID=A0AAD7P3Q1_9AGAR|nr:NADP-dependent oxidoreductase domain-containing protein [Mycena metata]
MSAITLKRTGQKVAPILLNFRTLLRIIDPKMPLVGFGLWKVTRSSCADTVYNAIKAGYRLFDGAGDYGNEKEAGEGVRRALADGLVKREELFITSKLWNTFHAKEHVKTMATKQLGLWGLDSIALKYVDPAERYPPEWFGADGKTVTLQDTPMQETYQAMEELVDAGLIKNIGISNCQGSLILDILRYARIKPQVLQVELHPYLTQEALVNFAKTHEIAITAYSSFGPQSYVELSMDQGAESLFTHDVIASVAKKHQRTTAQVLLRWATQRGLAVVPKSNDHQRLAQNLDSEAFDLTPEDIKSISALNKNFRLNDPADIDPRMGIFA